jgi:hypothetical protein
MGSLNGGPPNDLVHQIGLAAWSCSADMLRGLSIRDLLFNRPKTPTDSHKHWHIKQGQAKLCYRKLRLVLQTFSKDHIKMLPG